LSRNLKSSCQLDDHIEVLWNYRIHYRIANVIETSTGDRQDIRKYVPLSHGGTSEGSDVLEGSGLGGSGGDDDGVLHGVVLLKSLDELGDGGTLLTDGDVDAVKLLGLVVSVVPAAPKNWVSMSDQKGLKIDRLRTGSAWRRERQRSFRFDDHR
jgi:hypothetical protein